MFRNAVAHKFQLKVSTSNSGLKLPLFSFDRGHKNSLAASTSEKTKGAFNWLYSGIRMRRFTSKNHENFDVIGIQIRFAASFPNKILLRNRPEFNSKEKFDGYSVYSYSRIGSIVRVLRIVANSWSDRVVFN